jgi:hypothetical protein
MTQQQQIGQMGNRVNAGLTSRDFAESAIRTLLLSCGSFLLLCFVLSGFVQIVGGDTAPDICCSTDWRGNLRTIILSPVKENFALLCVCVVIGVSRGQSWWRFIPHRMPKNRNLVIFISSLLVWWFGVGAHGFPGWLSGSFAFLITYLVMVKSWQRFDLQYAVCLSLVYHCSFNLLWVLFGHDLSTFYRSLL